MRALRLLVLGVLSGLSCARPFPPPGGERDVAPPGLVATAPAALTSIPPGGTPVVFRFNERISERGFSEALVLVSPQDSSVRVSRSGSEVRVQIDGGWRPDRIYRVVLLPGIRDLFGNERREQAELVFSTGARIDSTALAGMVLDRITGAGTGTGVVAALHRQSAARYTAATDSAGFFSLRYLPPGEYDVSAWDDQNRNRRRDLLEPVDSGYTITIASPLDTIAHIFNVLIPDTTAPRVDRAEAIDSLHVRITTDDHFEPVALEAVGAIVHALPDSTVAARGVAIMAAVVFDRMQRDTVASAPSPARPVREAVVRLDQRLAPGTYVITIGPIVNLHGLSGSGTARFDVRAAPPPVVPPDTGSVPRIRR